MREGESIQAHLMPCVPSVLEIHRYIGLKVAFTYI
jgi:hypothetical protein